MNTINELKYYCQEKDPVGALMLTGEWGSGKTFLIEHQLAEELKDTHILVRISLFGVASVEAINCAVKKQWITDCTSVFSGIQNHKRAIKAGKTIFSGVATFVPYLKDVKDSVLSIDPLDYVTIKPEVGASDDKKKVVLVFDDLERSKLDTTDILGAINEYCENQHFNTIIVANEEKINRSNDENNHISYDTIKEKIVERTIRLDPDYDSIVDSIVDEKDWDDSSYTAFLKNNKSIIKSIFSTEIRNAAENKRKENNSSKIKKPRNIRSLKCALQDFHRVYDVLVQASLTDLNQYLYSFLAYYMAEKAGIAKEGNYGYLFTDEPVKQVFPGFKKQNLFITVRNWIHHGVWDNDTLNDEIERAKQKNKKLEPKDELRMSRIIDLDDETVQAGFDGLLNYAYEGKLTLDEYIYFIENSALIRECNIEGLSPIEWNRVVDGIDKRIDLDSHSDNRDNHMHYYIDEETWDRYSQEEINAYKIIRRYWKDEVVVFTKNKALYLEGLKKSGSYAFSECRNKRFKAFDEEMAQATADAFDKAQKYEKESFPDEFKDVFQYLSQSTDTDLDKTVSGFSKLKVLLNNLQEKYESEKKAIAVYHINNYLIIIDGMLSDVEKAKEQRGKTEDNV